MPLEPTRITAWSMSRLGDYETCARKAYFKYVKKLKDKGSPQAQRGIELHKQAEQFVKGEDPEIHFELRRVAKYLNKFKAMYAEGKVRAETQLAFTKEWTVCDWFDPATWLRVVIDITEEVAPGYLLISDWKSGKLKRDDEGYGAQLNLYSVAAISAGWCDEAKSQLIFIDHGVPVERPEGHVVRDILRPAQIYWENRVERMLTDTIFSPNPDYRNCMYCPFSKAVGGPCEYGR